MIVTVTDKKTNKLQHFEIRMACVHLVQAHKMVERDGYGADKAFLEPLRNNMKDIQEAGLSNLKIMPLTEEGAKHDQFHRSNYHYRGGKRYISHGNEELDPNPFIIRGKPMGMISAHVWKDYDTGNLMIRFLSEGDVKSLTDLQSKELAERFGEELLKACPIVLDSVKRETADYMLNYALEDLGAILERAEDLKRYVNTMK